jgi:Domain of unknown function (DUF4461)
MFQLQCTKCMCDSDWLRKNVDRARAKGCQMGPIRVEIDKLKELITEETGAVDVQWQSNWGLSSFRTALRGLLRVCRQHSDIVNLKGIYQRQRLYHCVLDFVFGSTYVLPFL